MAWRSANFSRSLVNAARSASFRSSSVRRASSDLLPNAARTTHRFSFSNPRTVQVLGCVQSMMPMHSVIVDARLTSYVAVEARAWCELSQGIFCRTCPDR